MKYILFLLLFLSQTHAYFILDGQLYNDQNQYMNVSNVKSINLDFFRTNYGFILLNDGTLYLARFNKNYGFDLFNRTLSYSTTEIEYPYIIENNDLYRFDEKKMKFKLLGYSLNDLCKRTVAENIQAETSFKNYFAIKKDQLVPIRYEQRPESCR